MDLSYPNLHARSRDFFGLTCQFRDTVFPMHTDVEAIAVYLITAYEKTYIKVIVLERHHRLISFYPNKLISLKYQGFLPQ